MKEESEMKPGARLLLLLALIAGLGHAPALLAVTCTSVAAGGLWNVPGTWTGCTGGNGTVANTPGPADTANINTTGASVVTVNVAVTVGGVNVNTGTLTQTQPLTVSNATLTGTLNIAGGTLTANVLTVNGPTNLTAGTLTVTSNNARRFDGLVTLSGGTWTGSTRAVTFRGGLTRNGGTFTPGTGVHTFDTTAAQTIAGTVAISIPSITIGAGVTLTNDVSAATGLSVTTALAGNVMVNAANRTLNIGFAGPPGITTLDATAAGNTVAYNRAGVQTVKQTSYANLTLSNSSAKTMTGVTVITGDLTISGTATMTGNAGFTVGGQMTYSSTAATTLTAGTPISVNRFTQTGAGGTLNPNSNTITVTGTGALTWTKTTGTFTANGTVDFTGASPQMGGAALTFNNLRIGVTGTATLTANAAIAGNVDVATGILNLGSFTANRAVGTGTFTVADGATLRIGGTPTTFPTGYTNPHALGATSTVQYDGTAQTVLNELAPGYGHLVLGGSGAKTMPAAAQAVRGNFIMQGTATATAGGALTIGGNFEINGAAANTFNGATFTHNLAGNFSRTGTFTAGTSTFNFNGTTATTQTITGATLFSGMTVATGAGGVTLGANTTVGALLTLTSGIVTTGANTLITTANCPGNISRTGGHVAGFLSLQVPAAAVTCVHHVGDGTAYRPISIDFPATTTAGTLTGSVSQAAGDHANIATSDLDALQNVNRYWTLTSGGGLGLGGGSYSATFTFVAGDVDTNADPATFEVARWDGAIWSATTAGTRTATSTQATGLTAFSDFAVGQRRLNNFLITVPGSPVSTCTAQAIGITARNSSNQTLTNYRGLVNLSTSSSHGDWSVNTANGTLTNGVADDGAATYQFVVADAGSITLNLTDDHADNLTISVNDSVVAVTSNSGALQFSGNSFVITNDTIQVAGRNQAMTVAMNGSASCTNPLASYTGVKNLKAWLTRDTDDPAGTAPTIVALSLPNALPGANNLTLTFTTGSASFNLSTTDVGKYVLNLRDDSGTYAGTPATPIQINGISATITTRPFALVVSGVKKGGTNNPGGTATAGAGFIAAADTFEATVGGYRYNPAVDGNNDGLPDAGATLAQVTLNGTTSGYRWPVTLSAASPFTPGAGTLGTLSNGSFIAGDFSGGAATKTTLSYNEVGSFTLSGSATNFLNSGVDLTNRIRIYDSTGAENAVIGRFFPDHFTLTTSAITPACAGGSFTYMGQPNLGYTFGIDARNKGDLNTGCGASGKALCNYINSPAYNTGTVTMQAEDSNNGTDLSARLPAPTASWSSGVYSFSTTTATFSRVNPPGAASGPFDSLRIGVKVTDADGPLIASQDINPATSTDCVAATNCTGKALAGGATTIVRFGRLAIGNRSGSALLPLLVPIEAQYWNGKSFVTNTIDGCTSIAASVLGSDVAMGPYTAPLTDTPKCLTAISGGGALVNGRKSLQLAAPGTTGSVDLTVNLGAVPTGDTCLSAGSAKTGATIANRPYLQGGAAFNQNPTARATFGIFRGSEEVIFIRENFQ